MFIFYELKSPIRKKPLSRYFEKTVLVNMSYIFIALLKFYVRHLGVNITGPECGSEDGSRLQQFRIVNSGNNLKELMRYMYRWC